MARVSLPHDARAGPTKPGVRAVTVQKLDPGPTDHVVEVGSCTGAVTVEVARRAGHVTALERKQSRLETTRKNIAANDVDAEIDRIVMNVSRLEGAGAATEAFRERGLVDGVVQFQVSHGYELAGATSFDSENPVYMLVGSAPAVAADGGGS